MIWGAYAAAESALRDGYLKSAQQFASGEAFSVEWEDDVPAAWLCLQWYDFPEGVTILQYGADGELLAEETAPTLSETVTRLQDGAQRAEIRAGGSGMYVSRCAVFGGGTLPEPFFPWQDIPDRLDYLLVATHPDDEVLYLGSVIPYYGAERGYVGTIVYVSHQMRLRITEAQNGAWEMGLRYRPIFFGYPCLGKITDEINKQAFDAEAMKKDLVRVYRRYRPLVVFAQDIVNGEYGHWQHILTAQAAVEAFTLAADPSYDPESAQTYGTWQVQKVFLHLYPEDPIRIDADEPLSFFGGKTAFEVARNAYRKHESQWQLYGSGLAVHKDESSDAFNRFGMAAGVVPVGTDAFDNIDETLFSFYVPPTPEPTEVPTPEPTEVPTPEPTEIPTPEPTASPAPVVTAAQNRTRTLRTVLLLAAGALLSGAAVVWAIRRRKRRM